MSLRAPDRKSEGALFSAASKIKSTSTLPFRGGDLPPLSAAEEAELVRRFQANQDRAAATRLVRSQLPFLRKAVAQYPSITRYPDGKNNSEGRSDAFQAACCGLLTALRSFDPDRGFRFITYASFFVHGEIVKITKSSTAEVSLNSPVSSSDEGDDIELIDSIISSDAPPEEDLCDADEAQRFARDLETKLAELSPREQRIFRARNLEADPVPLSDLGRELQISPERVRQIHESVFVRVCGAGTRPRPKARGDVPPINQSLTYSRPVQALIDAGVPADIAARTQAFVDRGLSPDAADHLARENDPRVNARFGIPGADDRLWRKRPERIWELGKCPKNENSSASDVNNDKAQPRRLATRRIWRARKNSGADA
jgi:RNA polymerase sigma factor (sigma-70 family)